MKTTTHCCSLRFLAVHAVWALMFIVLFVAVSPASAATFSGRAFAASINAPTVGGALYLSDTGALSPDGGWESAGSLSESVPGVFSANVLNASTSAGDSSASLADVVVFSGTAATLSASFILAEAHSGIGCGRATTQIYGLTFGGAPVVVTGAPNQVVSLLGVATLVINEQTISPGGSSAAVNALRLTLATGEEVKLASATSQLNPTGPALGGVQFASLSVERSFGFFKAQYLPAGPPPPEQPECIDFVTGGGHFSPPHSTRPGRVNFGFNAGPRSAQNPELKGHLNLVDHDDGTHVSGVDVDQYFPFPLDPEHCRTFEGNAKFNGVFGFRYTAVVCDYGEPGREDRFALEVRVGGGAQVYFVDNRDSTAVPQRGELDGGNIQLHKSKCTTPASVSAAQPNAGPKI